VAHIFRRLFISHLKTSNKSNKQTGGFMAKEVKGLNGQIEVYEDKIVIKRNGILAWGSHFRKGDKTIPIKSITSVQLKTASFFSRGFIQFGVLGGVESIGDVKAALKDENSVIFGRKHTAGFVELKQFIENKITNLSNKTGTNTSQSIDELEKLSDLFNRRIITEEEFTAKKKQILGI
jgi:hypothetical protein